MRGDGYYTTFLFNFPRDGEYPVRVRATAAQGTARLLTGGGSRAFRLPTAVNRSRWCTFICASVVIFHKNINNGISVYSFSVIDSVVINNELAGAKR